MIWHEKCYVYNLLWKVVDLAFLFEINIKSFYFFNLTINAHLLLVGWRVNNNNNNNNTNNNNKMNLSIFY